MSEVKFGYSIYLSERVEELLRDGTLDEIIKAVEADLNTEWKQSSPEDSRSRELIYHELHALNRIQLKMSAIVDSLKMARRADGPY